MATQPLMLPEKTLAEIDALVSSGQATDRAAVVADLVARELADAAKRRAFDQAIEEGYASGFVQMTTEDLRAHLRARHAKPD